MTEYLKKNIALECAVDLQQEKMSSMSAHQYCSNQASVKSVECDSTAVVKQCTPQVFSRHFARLAQYCALDDSAQKEILRLFHPTAAVPLHCAWPEISVTFWAIPSSEEAWNAIVRLLLKTLRPRIYQAAETRTAQHELFMVVPLKPLVITQAGFEVWMERFADCIGQSAGCICFSDYFGDQMMGSLMRLSSCRKTMSNFPCQYHKDFCMLYSKLASDRSQAERVWNVTGMDYTSENFIQSALALRSSRAREKAMSEEASKWKMKFRVLQEKLQKSGVGGEECKFQVGSAASETECPHAGSPEVSAVFAAFSMGARSSMDVGDILPRPSLTEIPPAESDRPRIWHDMMDDFEEVWPITARSDRTNDASTLPRMPVPVNMASPPFAETIIWSVHHQATH
jgi:hypothetical protein